MGWTPLHYAADNGMVALTEELLAAGADLNAKSKGAPGTVKTASTCVRVVLPPVRPGQVILARWMP